MNLHDARTAIILTLSRMNVAYNKPVFDEWVLVVLAREQGAVLSSYDGPRAELYQSKFKEDVQPIRAELDQHKLEIGDFVFVPDALGTRYDAELALQCYALALGLFRRKLGEGDLRATAAAGATETKH